MFILFVNGEIVIMVRAIVGANWGDEGKGKITDLLSRRILLFAFRAVQMQATLL